MSHGNQEVMQSCPIAASRKKSFRVAPPVSSFLFQEDHKGFCYDAERL